MSRSFILYISFIFFPSVLSAQLKWQNVDSMFQPLPLSVHVYKTTDLLDGKPNIAYYVEADLKDKKLEFTVDTTFKRRLSPAKFYEKNNKPILVVNTTFFSFATNQNLNVVIKDRKLLAYNIHTINGRGKDTFTYRHPFGSAIGIAKKGEVDVAWIYTDSTRKFSYAAQSPMLPLKDSLPMIRYADRKKDVAFNKWKVRTAVGGGPVLIQEGEIRISNNEELKFAGKAIDDKHPRTAMGYTLNNKLIILVIEGRNTGNAEGATLTQAARMLKEIGCWESLNLDGGGSSCMLVNGRETIRVSDASGQRPVPAVFIIKYK